MTFLGQMVHQPEAFFLAFSGQKEIPTSAAPVKKGFFSVQNRFQRIFTLLSWKSKHGLKWFFLAFSLGIWGIKGTILNLSALRALVVVVVVSCIVSRQTTRYFPMEWLDPPSDQRIGHSLFTGSSLSFKIILAWFRISSWIERCWKVFCERPMKRC